MKSALLIFSVFTIGLSMAQENSTDPDSLFVSQRPKVEVEDSLFKIKKADFVQQYSTDDTTAALISMFYRKRTTAKTQLGIVPITLVGGLVAQALYKDALGPGKEWVRNNALTLGGLISVGVSLESYMKLRVYSRKELYLALQRYKNGEGVLDEHYFQFKESDFASDTVLKTKGYQHVE